MSCKPSPAQKGSSSTKVRLPEDCPSLRDQLRLHGLLFEGQTILESAAVDNRCREFLCLDLQLYNPTVVHRRVNSIMNAAYKHRGVLAPENTEENWMNLAEYTIRELNWLSQYDNVAPRDVGLLIAILATARVRALNNSIGGQSQLSQRPGVHFLGPLDKFVSFLRQEKPLLLPASLSTGFPQAPNDKFETVNTADDDKEKDGVGDDAEGAFEDGDDDTNSWHTAMEFMDDPCVVEKGDLDDEFNGVIEEHL